MDENNTLIDNSEAGRLVHDDSRWPALQDAVQSALTITADQDPEVEDESEDEILDDADVVDDNFDDLATSATVLQTSDDEPGLQHPAPGAMSHNTLPHTSEAPPPLFDAAYISLDEDSDLPDLEEIPVGDQTVQQTTQAALEDSLHMWKLQADIHRFPEVEYNKTCPSFVDLPFNLLQTDERDIHMFRDIRFDADFEIRPPDSSYSEVLCRQALDQKEQPGLQAPLAFMERLNMIAQIPEMGVIVIASQIGRVGILTMTRWEAPKQSGFKIECILPFVSEEHKGLRPKKPLMGIAVGPIQGQETALPQESPRMGRQSPRRFRLLMAYSDHTILTYEISRPNEEDDIVVV